MPSLELAVLDWNGNALPAAQMGEIYVLDEAWNPIPNAIQSRQDGKVITSTISDTGRIIISYKLIIPDFGHLVLYADHGGDGYPLSSKETLRLDLLEEIARSRLLTTELIAKPYLDTSSVPSDTLIRIGNARLASERIGNSTGAERMQAIQTVIREAGLASEELVVFDARNRIARYAEPRKDFEFGANAFLNRPDTPERNQCVERFATLVSVPFFGWAGSDPIELNSFSHVDTILNWAVSKGMRVKGEPLFWMDPENPAPQEYQAMPAGWMEQFARYRVQTIVTAFHGPIGAWNVIEDACSPNNPFKYTSQELIVITKACAEGAKKADPNALTIATCGFLRGEYRANTAANLHPALTPFQYFQECLNAEIPLDGLGLKITDIDMDLFEWKRLLDRFATLQRPIHITRFDVPATGTDMAWHGSWNDERQAEFIEAFYTLCYAHPAIREVTYWSIVEPSFPENRALALDDYTPRPAWHRLVNLSETWRKISVGPTVDTAASPQP